MTSEMHISQERMQEIAEAAALEKKGGTTQASILTVEESAHLQECLKCIETFGDRIRAAIQERMPDHTSEDAV